MKDLTDFERDLKDSYKKLDIEAGKYNRPEFDKVYKYIEDSADFSMPLKTGELIDEALQKAGFADDKDFVEDFKKYREIEQKARELQLMIFYVPKKSNEQKQVLTKNEWQFASIGVFVPESIQDSMDNILEKDLKEGKGLYFQGTEIEWEDEDIDELLMIEIYGLKCSLEPVYREFQKYEIDILLREMGGLKNLMKFLKDIALIIKNNTDKPNKIRNRVIKILKELDEITGIGLIWQLLVLQGILKWMEGINLNENDNGFVQAQLLCDWIGEQLKEKEIVFCRFFWSDKDKERLIPLCDYLYSTEIGRQVQRLIFIDTDIPSTQEEGKNEDSLIPAEFDNSKLSEIMKDDLIEQFLKNEKRLKADGFITPNNTWVNGRGKNQTKTLNDLARLILLLDNKHYLKKKYDNKKLESKHYKHFFEKRYTVTIKEQFQKAINNKISSLEIADITFSYF